MNDEWIEIEIRTDHGTAQISHRRREGTSIYVSDDDHKYVDPGPLDRELLARVLREGADLLLSRQEACS